MKKPNIIVILVDDMGYSDLGSYGGEIRTPNLDRLSANGLRFTQSYNSARCCPSRASLLTGLYSHQAGIANFTGRDQTAELGPAYLGRLNNNCVTLAEVLKTAGYSTYGVGKWHVGDQINPIDRGFDEYYGFIKGHSAPQWDPSYYHRYPETRTPELSFADDAFYATEAFNDYAVEFIDQAQQKDNPYFLYLAHSAPHFPLHAPEETRDSYLDIYRRGWDVLRRERYARQQDSGLATENWQFTARSLVPIEENDAIANGYSGKQNPAWEDLPQDRQEDLAYRMAVFAAMIEHIDRGIGRIIDRLKETGELDNTLILFTSDNGACYEWGPFGFDERSRSGVTHLHKGKDLKKIGGPDTYHSVGSAWSCLSNTPLRMYKHYNHEGGNCSPFIAHWPEGTVQPDRWVRTPMHLFDIMPTICEITESEYPETYRGERIHPQEGTSLVPLFNAQNLPERSLCFDHFEASAIRRGKWKLLKGNTRYPNRDWELYDMEIDRCETSDLSSEHPELVKSLEREWTEWAVSVKVHPYYKEVTP